METEKVQNICKAPWITEIVSNHFQDTMEENKSLVGRWAVYGACGSIDILNVARTTENASGD